MSIKSIRTGWTGISARAGNIIPLATGGSEVKTVGNFRYHFFTVTSSLVVEQPGDFEILVIGAGGGGGRDTGGGGGAGAIEPASGYTTQTLGLGNYSITIASGAAGSATFGVKGGTASGTSFAGTSTITANGGGGGGSSGSADGAAGGSGGGARGAGTSTGGSANGNNTNAGGSTTSGTLRGGGGGGAGGAGAAGTSTGNGGAGKLASDFDANLTGTNFTTLTGYPTKRFSAGGGGGAESPTSAGTGGTGGGGDGNNNGAGGGNATSFGSGGGGGSGTLPTLSGGNGADGLVIVRYSIA